jgi:hypothetical protein
MRRDSFHAGDCQPLGHGRMLSGCSQHSEVHNSSVATAFNLSQTLQISRPIFRFALAILNLLPNLSKDVRGNVALDVNKSPDSHQPLHRLDQFF